MNKFRWLTFLGVICIIATIFFGIVEVNGSLQIPFIVLGIILSFIVIGLGEILYHLQNGGKK